MKAVIIGAGTAGLTAAFLLKRRGVEIEVIERDSYAGGGAHSFEWQGHTCDWATHRLFTHDEHTLQQLLSLVPMNRLERRSRVYLGGKWLKDPVDVAQLCSRFFPGKTAAIPWTYFTRPKGLPEDSFKNYVQARFGAALSDFLFSPYTVKMFGIPPEQISVEWARKKVRIAGPLDVFKPGSKKKFNYFYYPAEGGYGVIPDRLYTEVKDHVRLSAQVSSFAFEDGNIKSVSYRQNGAQQTATGDIFISTVPLTDLCRMLGHDSSLTYRPVSAVYLLMNKPQTSPYHWIYFMDGDVTVNRLCEFKNLNHSLGPDNTNVICAEVTDHNPPDVVEKVIKDLIGSGLITRDDILDTNVVRRDHSYPVYRCDYEQDVDAAEKFLARFNNLRSVGRAAQFEHMEVDDCFSAATQLVREIIAETKTSPEVLHTKRSDLSVEPKLAVVVASLESADDTLACVQSVAASDYGSLDILLVTDPAEQGLRDRITTALPHVQLLTRPSGMGIPAAFNLGCNSALGRNADFVFLCQGGSTVEANALGKLVRVAQRDPEAGILAPKILSYERQDHIWSIGAQFRKFPPSIKTIGLGQRDDKRFTESREVEFAVSSGLLVKREVFERIGLFDPGYRFYYEDVDFSKRARKAGFRIRFAPEAKMYHKEVMELSRTPEFHYTWGESFSRYYRRHVRPLVVKLPLHLAYLLIREALTGNAKNVPSLFRGAMKGMHKRISDPPQLDAEFIEQS